MLEFRAGGGRIIKIIIFEGPMEVFEQRPPKVHQDTHFVRMSMGGAYNRGGRRT